MAKINDVCGGTYELCSLASKTGKCTCPKPAPVVTLRAGDSYSLTTGRLTPAPTHRTTTGCESLVHPVRRSLGRNDLNAMHATLRNA